VHSTFTQPDFDSIFVAAVHAVDEAYVRVPVAESAPVIRERAFAYELYHQLRLRCDTTGYTLTGELEKATHPDMIVREIKRLAPDLLIHVPGVRRGNFVAVEIKGGRPRRSRLQKDLNSLCFLRERFRYERLLYLIYGITERQTNSIAASINRYAQSHSNRPSLRHVQLWVRRSNERLPRLIDWSG
jgi:hypothetical protein